jgi:hypothetical protein
VKADAMELSEPFRNRMEYGIAEIPDEIIQKAEIIVHKFSLVLGNHVPVLSRHLMKAPLFNPAE